MLPPTFPQALAAPLHMSILTAKQFPLRVTGLVHLSNTIQYVEPVKTGVPFDLAASLSSAVATEKGIELTLQTDLSVAGRKHWSADAVLLARTPGRRRRRSSAARPNLEQYSKIDRWSAYRNTGRRYAAVSGDYNPIHLHGLTARLFGFNRPIAHGMWSLARGLTGLHDALKTPYEIRAQFLRPMPLPTGVNLLYDENTRAFCIVDSKTNKAYLIGSIA